MLQNALRASHTVRRHNVRLLSDSAHTSSGSVFIDSVFPIQLGRFDLRRYIGALQTETLLDAVKTRLASVHAHGFTITSVEPHPKDGGVFVRFDYSASDDPDALRTIEHDLRQTLVNDGQLPSWLGLGTHAGHIWLVKGTPWTEDMNRYASPFLKIAFEGPDVHEESLYALLRPYGHIKELTEPTPVPAGTQRFSMVTFNHTRSATIARNVLHGLTVPSSTSTSSSSSVTRLRTIYENPIKGHAIRDWLSSHPRIVLPIVLTLVGTLTYTIFDPVRALMIQGKVEEWFDFRENAVYQWLRTNTYDRIYTGNGDAVKTTKTDVWKEREEAEEAVRTYLRDLPTTVAFVHGPQGSGKTTMLRTVLDQNERNTLIIDCRPLLKASSDTALVSGLAKQTGYWPVFSFLSSMNHMIDLASVGLIGQKAGFSSSLTDQLHSILSITTDALKNVSSSHRAAIQSKMARTANQKTRKEEEEGRRARVREGRWHDGRLDCVAGNGVMSELGVGDERFGEDFREGVGRGEGRGENEKEGAGGGQARGENEMGDVGKNGHGNREKADSPKKQQQQQTLEDVEAVESLPIVLIRNFDLKGGASRDELMEVIAQWTASLAESQIAHVIVVSDNRENMKRLTKALPTKPLHIIALDDADSSSSLAFVREKLRDSDVDVEFTAAQTGYIERLGGRASDLESLIHKMRGGQRVEEAVEDIIHRGVGEIHKNAFGDDAEDAKSLPWTREQVWIVLKKLAGAPEISYSETLLDFPFKGDESPLRNMEHAELITMGTHNGRPTTIKPGKPIFRYVFQRLAQDPIFQATQDLAYNEKAIAGADSKVQAYEEELLRLKEMGAQPSSWAASVLGMSSVLSQRAGYLVEKIRAAQDKIEALERKNGELKRTLAGKGRGRGRK